MTETWVQATSFAPVGKSRDGDAAKYCAKPAPEDAARFLNSCGPDYAKACMAAFLERFGRQYVEQVRAKL